MIRSLWKSFLTGLLIIFPAILTVAILQVLIKWVSILVLDPLLKILGPILPMDRVLLARTVIFFGFLLMVTLVGFGTRLLVIRRFFQWGEAIVRQVPMVGKIYWTIREIASTFTGGRRGVFTDVVLLEWPRTGLYVIGFVTAQGKGEIPEKVGKPITNVFVPTTPNPTSGYLVMIPDQDLTPLSMSVEEGMRLVISGGVSGPEDERLQGTL